MNRGRNDRPNRGGHGRSYDNVNNSRKSTPLRPPVKKENPSPSPVGPMSSPPGTTGNVSQNRDSVHDTGPSQSQKPSVPNKEETAQELRPRMDPKMNVVKSDDRENRDRRPHGHNRDHDRRGGDDNPSEQMSTENSGRKVEKKFTQRCRLFVGNLTPDTTEDDFKTLFQKYGEISEVFLNKSKGFGFIRLDTRYNAEAAKAELDGIMRKNRMLRVRFATHGAALKVKNIPPCVSNELLEQAFSQFGVVERAVVIVDDRGRPTSEGIVEFARKPGAQNALTRIKEGVFLLTSSPTPITVEPLEQRDEEDGLPEKNIPKNPAYHHERENPPRFATLGAFEFQWGNRWKANEESEKQQRETLERQLQDNRDKLESEMEMSKHEHQTVRMRQELARRQEELNRFEETTREMLNRQQEQLRQREDRRREEKQQEELLRRQQLVGMAMSQQPDLRRRQQQSDDMVRHVNGMQMRGGNNSSGPASSMPGIPGNSGQGILNNPNVQAMQSIQGISGNGNGGRMGPSQGQPIPSRQSRFDQPPQPMGGRVQALAGGMGGPQGQGGGSYGAGSNAGPRPLDEIRTRPPQSMDRRDMDRRERRDVDYAMAKRPRRY